MNAITFDKLTYVDRLTKAGIMEDQARAQADALDVALRDTVVTKADLHKELTALRADMTGMEHRLEALRDTVATKAELEALEHRLEALRDTVATKAELVELRAELRTEIANTRTEILKWMFAALLGQTAMIAALIRFL